MSHIRAIGRRGLRSGSCPDFDSYRTRVTACRGRARRDAATLSAAGMGVLTMIGVAAIAVLVAAAAVRVQDELPSPSNTAQKE